MNEYKVWDKENKCWNKGNLSLTPDGKLYECYGDGCYKFEPINDKSIIVFSTGLKDKNGKLIFTGDVCFVKRPNTFFNKGENFIVEYNKENHAFMYKYKRCGTWNWAFGNNGHYLIGRNRGKSTVCEIVGNIYEDKHLLTKKE